MTSVGTVGTSPLSLLLQDVSVEMTGKDVQRLEEAGPLIVPGTRINITFLENEDLELRLRAARAVRDLGFVPVPHVSARRLRSREMLEEYLGALEQERSSEHLFVVGGDPATPHGPYADALAVMSSGVLQSHGTTDIGVSGYPEGHPGIAEDSLWAALEGKAALLAEQGLAGSVITQFGFDVDPVLGWAEEVRRRGIDLPVRIGVPGPAGVRRLLSYAGRFGVGTSAGIAKKYGFSLTNLMGTAGPDRFVRALAEGYRPERHGELKLHFYTFGGLRATSEWLARFRQEEA